MILLNNKIWKKLLFQFIVLSDPSDLSDLSDREPP